MSIFFTGIIASKVRLASTPPAASASISARVCTAIVTNDVKGIVFAGTGAGGLSSFEKGALKSLLASAGSRPALMRPSRVGNSRVIGLTASREEYEALGVIPADNLNPQKARVLLVLALTKTNRSFTSAIPTR
jgi:L-asparaginase/Glu-tRNA(Gln) amidotransferase subunit D